MAHGLSSSAAHGGLSGPGLEPVSPALAGGFLTTVPLGKPCTEFCNIFKLEFIHSTLLSTH